MCNPLGIGVHVLREVTDNAFDGLGAIALRHDASKAYAPIPKLQGEFLHDRPVEYPTAGPTDIVGGGASSSARNQRCSKPRSADVHETIRPRNEMSGRPRLKNH